MAMNREHKRLLQRQGQLDAEGNQKAERRKAPSPTAPKEPRTKPRQFVREVNAELRKVVWPSRTELIQYTTVVVVFVVTIMLVVYGMDTGFAKLSLWIFG